MRNPICLVAVACVTAFASAQNPCTYPPAVAGTFLTPFRGGTYLGMPNAVNGANMFFDLVVRENLEVSRIDVNVLDDGAIAGNPNLVGQTTTLLVWLTPGTYVGQHNVPSAWTQVASGTLTVATPNSPSPAIFNPPFLLPTGTYGVALQHVPTANGPLHPYYTNPTTTVGTPTTYTGTYLTLTAGAAQADAFVSGAVTPRVVNTQFHYVPSQTAAFHRGYGSGCYRTPPSWYETFPVPPAQFDLANRSIRMTNHTDGYTVAAASAGLFTPTGPSLTASAPGTTSTPAAPWDDALSAPITLPFSFAWPGGSSNQVIVGSNGYLFLQPSTATAPFTGDVTGLLGDAARLAPFWTDLDASAGGGLHFDVGPGNQAVYITWLNVPQRGAAGGANTVQIALFQNGTIEFRYGACAISAHPALAGWSPGGAALDPGSRDVSATLPFVASDGSLPVVLGMAARPVLGNANSLEVSDIRANTPAGLLFLGFTPFAAGIPLGAFGMVDCMQYITPTVTNVFLANGSTASIPWTIPNNPILAGVQIVGQVAIFAAGLNPAGLLTSNGLCVVPGPR